MLFLPLVAMMFLASCGNDGKDSGKVSLGVSPLALEYAASGNESKTITVTAVNLKWEYEISASGNGWITVTPSGDKELIVTVSDNEGDQVRTGLVTVKPVDHEEIRAIGVTVTQEAGSAQEYSLTVDPAALTFTSDATEPQSVTVTTVGEGLTWKAEAEKNASWLHVQQDGDKINVSVDSYDNTEISRSANIVVTPNSEKAKPKSVRVTQLPAETVPTLSVTPMDDMHFDWNEDGKNNMLTVTAISVEWSIATEDADGKSVSWIKCQKSGDANIVVTVERNTETQPRSGYVVVRSHTKGVDDVKIRVEQKAGKKNYSNLTENVELTMEPAGGFYYSIKPAQVWDDTTPYTYWELEIWSTGLTRAFNHGYYEYTGTGSRMALKMFTTRVNYNDDQEFYIPDGEYILQDYPAVVKGGDPNTLVTGRYTNDLRTPSGSWYSRIENDAFTDAAPLTEGKLTVSKNAQDVYTFTFDFKDDAGYSITGTAVSEVTDTRINYYPEQPTENPGNPEEPEDPGFTPQQ